MPVIKIEFDDTVLGAHEAQSLAEAARDIVAEETGIADVFVYANSARIKVKIAPVEVFVEMSAHEIKDIDDLVRRIKGRLGEWKKRSGFSDPINFTLIPMTWKIEIGI